MKNYEERCLNFSVVVPIHNEAKYLPYSLPAIYSLEPDEVILLFDRCTDESLSVAKDISQRLGIKSKTIFVELNESSQEWNFRVAFLRRYGYRMAHNDTILTTDADMILDCDIKNQIQKIGKNGVALVSFGYYIYPYTIQFFIESLIFKIFPIMEFTGQYAISKRAWLETEDEESVKKVYRSEDIHLCLSIIKKYRRLHIKTKSRHLRPDESRIRHYRKGFLYWDVGHNPAWKMLLYSILYLRPEGMAGYLHARLGGSWR